MMYVEVSCVNSGKIPYLNQVDGSGVLVCYENRKPDDSNGLDARLWPSDILWESWAMVFRAQGSKPSNLRAIVRSTIVNESTQIVLWKATEFSTCSKKSQHYHIKYTKREPGFLRLSWERKWC